MSHSITFPEVHWKFRNFEIFVPAQTLKKGEIFGIFGKSGSGKTTYLKRIREHFAPGKVLFMSQFDCLLEEITIRQNIELGLAYSGKDPKTFKNWETQYAEILKDFEVDRHINKYPRMMSGGQRKRAEIVRSLMMDPEIMLFDEPFQGIGHIFETVSTKYIVERAEKKDSVTVIVSHDFNLLCKFCDRIMLVDDKGVIEVAPTNEASWRPMLLRSAWTLGVENIIPSSLLGDFTHPKLDRSKQDFLGAWAHSSFWVPQETPHTIHLKPRSITNQRTYRLHGDTYTHIDIEIGDLKEPLSLIGRGVIESEKDLKLEVRDAWGITL